MVPSPAVIGFYISKCAKPQEGSPALSVSAIEWHLSGLSSNYRQRDLHFELRDRHIAEVWGGIKLQRAKPPTQKAAVLIEDVLKLVGALSFSLRDLRDRAILLIGYAGGLRRTEIAGLDVSTNESDDSRGYVELLDGGAVLHTKGKTGWREVEIGRGSSDQTCPVHALEQWLHYTKIDFGPIFMRTSRDGKMAPEARLNDKHIVRLIKQTVLNSGIRSDLPKKEPLALYSGYSLLAGPATSAEVDEHYVQKHLGHASSEMTRRY